MKKLTFLVIIGLLFSFSTPLLAQTNGSGNCFTFTNNMTFGSTDVSASGQVSILQNFLISKGLLTMPVGVSTGFFGNLTKTALGSFQASVNISPAAGYFGPITRAYLNSQCSAVYSPSSNGNTSNTQYSDSGAQSNTQSQSNTNTQFNNGEGGGSNSGSTYQFPPLITPTISSLNPTSGPVGSQVTIHGSGFSTSTNTIYFGSKWIQSGSSDGTTLVFVVPDTTSGASSDCGYKGADCTALDNSGTPTSSNTNVSVSVNNGNGTSNSVTFTVTSS
jgi:hypothetical protein